VWGGRQIFIVILVINVMMSSIRSSSCLIINVPGENNEKEQAPVNFILLVPNFSAAERKLP
jgi:hypothetical protein